MDVYIYIYDISFPPIHKEKHQISNPNPKKTPFNFLRQVGIGAGVGYGVGRCDAPVEVGTFWKTPRILTAVATTKWFDKGELGGGFRYFFYFLARSLGK